MDTAWSRFKRTLTFRRKKKSDSDSATPGASDGGKPHQWLEDEKKVREGTCSFQVKYLGNIEVTESRGMHVCEEAIKKLKARARGKQQRAILYVSGDAIRVVDEITKLKSPTEQKGLIVDQTIEKVSFCSPDRNHEKAFAYICRDGTTRRWLCHGFLAVRDSGERLSHAVGCAFAVCLERKQQREHDVAVKAEFSDAKGTSFTRIGSFRQTTLTEKLLDPQISQVAEPPPPPSHPVSSVDDSTYAIPRPRASEDLMYRRFASMRLPSSASAYDYSSTAATSSSVTTPTNGPATWKVPSSMSATQFPPANPLLLPPPPSSAAASFRRSASLRLDSNTAANVVAATRRPGAPMYTPSQFSNVQNQITSSLSTSSQLGAAGGMLAFPRSSSANAGFSTPIYGNITSVPSIPEEDPWTSPPSQQVAVAADAVTQLCEQLTAGLLSSPQQSNNVVSSAPAAVAAKSLYTSVPQMNSTTPLNVMTNSIGTVSPAAPTSPFGNATVASSSSARNPFLATSNVATTPLANPVSTTPVYAPVPVVAQQQTSPYSFVPAVPVTNHFPATPQWQAFPPTNNVSGGLSVASPQQQQHYQQPQQLQTTSLPWPPVATNDPFAPSVGISNSTSNNNPFKDAPFIANF